MASRAALAALLLWLPTFAFALNPLQTGSTDDIVAAIDKIVKNKTADKNTVSSLTQVLQNPESDIRVRERAAWALGELNAKSGVPVLMEAAKHKGLLIRSAALEALAQLRARAALPTFVSIAESDPILSLRQRATLALGLLQWDQTIPHLVKLSSDPTPEVKGAAALAMAATQSKQNDFSELLKEMAAEEDPYVKKRAQMALEVAGRKNQTVRTQLAAEDEDIRQFAALYFRTHGGSADLKAIKDAWGSEPNDDVRQEMDQAMSAIKRRAAEAKAKQEKAEKEAAQKNAGEAPRKATP